MGTPRRWAVAPAALAIVLAGVCALRADTIRLKDGRTILGKVAGRENGQVAIQIGDAKLAVAESQIDRIETESDAVYLLKRIQDLASRSQWDLALQTCEAAAAAGADANVLQNLRASLVSARALSKDPKECMKPEARKHYESAMYMLDRALLREAADEMAEAHQLDPENLEILRQVAAMDYAFYLRGDMPLSSLEKTVQKLLTLAPDDPNAKRYLAQAQNREYSLEDQRKQAIETLFEQIQRAYGEGRLEPQLLSDIRRLRSYQPDDAKLEELARIEADVRPKIEAKILQAQAGVQIAANEAVQKAVQERKDAVVQDAQKAKGEALKGFNAKKARKGRGR